MRFAAPMLLAIVCSSCATTIKPVSVQAPKHSEPIIARIAGRHRTIVVRYGLSGPTYSLESTSGELLVGQMTIGELALKNPEMFQIVKTMQDGLLWAGLDGDAR